MNKVWITGRLVRNPEIRKQAGGEGVKVANYTLAVNRRVHQGEQQEADFIRCVAFGKSAEFAEKYLRKGIKISVAGHIQTGSYTNRDGQRVNTVDVVIDEQEFAESRKNEDRP